ncbi:MAG: hypothetical protein Q8R08_04395 [bacterium]|nr:hypothetical protein [bacterium]
MSRLELINYIRQNSKDGFSKKEIRNALFAAGWKQKEVDMAFSSMGARRRTLARIIAVIVLTPLVGFGSAWLYSISQNDIPEAQAPAPGQVAGISTETLEERQARDSQRIADVALLQTALATYFGTHQLYPKNLITLVTDSLMSELPKDPESQEPYLYNPLGEPPLYYSLSFILETGAGSLTKGFHSVSSEDEN